MRNIDILIHVISQNIVEFKDMATKPSTIILLSTDQKVKDALNIDGLESSIAKLGTRQTVKHTRNINKPTSENDQSVSKIKK